jgi:predicted restriction endonuclease
MARSPAWTRIELLLAFRLYCRTPFGKLHRGNPQIIELAQLINRTASAVAMKACNFASLDPVQQARGIRALSNLSAADKSLWTEFNNDSVSVAAEAEAAHERLTIDASSIARQTATVDDIVLPEGPTEVERTIRARRVQGFFRASVLSAYGYRCALTGIRQPELLNASHIVPWASDESRRAHPENGLCLNALHDRAFDRGLITFDEDWRLVLSPSVIGADVSEFQKQSLLDLDGHRLALPERFSPSSTAMNHHRQHIFRASA